MYPCSEFRLQLNPKIKCESQDAMLVLTNLTIQAILLDHNSHVRMDNISSCFYFFFFFSFFGLVFLFLGGCPMINESYREIVRFWGGFRNKEGTCTGLERLTKWVLSYILFLVFF